MTKLLGILLGVGTVLTGSIIGLSDYLPGSQILEGNLFFDTTNNSTPAIYVGTSEVLAPTSGGLGFTTNGTQSGVVLKDGTITAIASRTVACVGTGGVVNYDVCRMPNPLGNTGSVVRVALMVAASPKVVGLDCGFSKAVQTQTGTVFTNLNNVQSSTGSIFVFGTGSVRWNGADAIKCGTIGVPTTSFSAKLKVDYFDDTSE